MGRPRKGEEKHRPIHLGFKVSKELNAQLRRLARKRRSPMSDVVVEILAKGLREAARAEEAAREDRPTAGGGHAKR